MITSQVLMFLDSPKTWKSKYTEKNIFVFSNKKIHLLYTKDYIMAKK